MHGMRQIARYWLICNEQFLFYISQRVILAGKSHVVCNLCTGHALVCKDEIHVIP